MVGVLHVSLAVTSALTLASVGKLAASGLQPRLLPVGALVMLGAVVSRIVIVCAWFLGLPQRSVAVHVRVIVFVTLLIQVPATSLSENVTTVAVWHCGKLWPVFS